MRIAIVGYGRMGQRISALAADSGIEVALIVRNADELKSAKWHGIDVAIEFTRPDAALQNIELLARAGVSVVSGTTGWFDDLDKARAIIHDTGTSLVYSANYSIGVQLTFRLAETLGALAAPLENAEAYGWEAHHSAKKDAPSGTLLVLAERLRAGGFKQPLDLSSSRAGSIPGTHELAVDLPDETITLSHTARSRDGFARGALLAAKFAVSNKGVFEFGEVLFGR